MIFLALLLGIGVISGLTFLFLIATAPQAPGMCPRCGAAVWAGLCEACQREGRQ